MAKVGINVYGFKYTGGTKKTSNANTFVFNLTPLTKTIDGVNYPYCITTSNAPFQVTSGSSTLTIHEVLDSNFTDTCCFGENDTFTLSQSDNNAAYLDSGTVTNSYKDLFETAVGRGNRNHTIAPLDNNPILPFMRSIQASSVTFQGNAVSGSFDMLYYTFSTKKSAERKFYQGWTPKRKEASYVLPVVDASNNHIGWYPVSNNARADQDEYIYGIDYYYVILSAGQSNSMAYGEGSPDFLDLDAPNPRIKQLARRASTNGKLTFKGYGCDVGYASKYNDIIPLDHCPHDVEISTASLNNTKRAANTGTTTPAYAQTDWRDYGCHGYAINVAKKLLPNLPSNVGILIVPCGRGGSSFTNTTTNGSFSETSGASSNSDKWGVNLPLYKDLLFRAKKALDYNPKNKLLGIIWLQGEFDLSGANYANQPNLFKAMKQQLSTDLASYNDRIVGGANALKWYVGDTTYYWKAQYPTQYNAVFGAYKNKESENILYSNLMTDSSGNIPTNKEDTDSTYSSGLKYWGASNRPNSSSWVSRIREAHFSTKAHQNQISNVYSETIKANLPLDRELDKNPENIKRYQNMSFEQDLSAWASYFKVGGYASQSGNVYGRIVEINGRTAKVQILSGGDTKFTSDRNKKVLFDASENVGLILRQDSQNKKQYLVSYENQKFVASKKVGIGGNAPYTVTSYADGSIANTQIMTLNNEALEIGAFIHQLDNATVGIFTSSGVSEVTIVDSNAQPPKPTLNPDVPTLNFQNVGVGATLNVTNLSGYELQYEGFDSEALTFDKQNANTIRITSKSIQNDKNFVAKLYLFNPQNNLKSEPYNISIRVARDPNWVNPNPTKPPKPIVASGTTTLNIVRVGDVGTFNITNKGNYQVLGELNGDDCVTMTYPTNSSVKVQGKSIANNASTTLSIYLVDTQNNLKSEPYNISIRVARDPSAVTPPPTPQPSGLIERGPKYWRVKL